MKFAAAALALAGVASAAGYGYGYNTTSTPDVYPVTSASVYPVSYPTYTSEVVSSYETYCPFPTTLTYGTYTYTVVSVRICPARAGGG